MTDGINNMIVEFSENIMSPNSKISEAIELLNNEPLKIIFVLDKTKSLVGTVTDGDIRRGTISGLNQSDSVSQIMNKNFTYFTDEVNSIFIENEMNSRDLLAIPILDKDKRVLRVHALKDLSYPEFVENTAIIMAGGFGKRLGVLTKDTPKPLLKIGKNVVVINWKSIIFAPDSGFLTNLTSESLKSKKNNIKIHPFQDALSRQGQTKSQ